MVLTTQPLHQGPAQRRCPRARQHKLSASSLVFIPHHQSPLVPCSSLMYLEGQASARHKHFGWEDNPQIPPLPTSVLRWAKRLYLPHPPKSQYGGCINNTIQGGQTLTSDVGVKNRFQVSECGTEWTSDRSM